jgi:hypothetical protein
LAGTTETQLLSNKNMLNFGLYNTVGIAPILTGYTHGQSLPGPQSFQDAVYAPSQKRLYFIPFRQANEAVWYYLDCTDGTVYSYTHGFGTTISDFAYLGGAYSPNQQRIYMASLEGRAIWHYIDCSNPDLPNGTATLVAYIHGFGAGISRYDGVVYSPTQDRMYFIPSIATTQTDWYYIDCTTGDLIAYTHGATVVSSGYSSGAYCPNQNRIYFTPHLQENETNWHYIDCDAIVDGDIVHAYPHGFTIANSGGYRGKPTYAPTQKRIYLVPFGHSSQTTWHYIDCSNDNQADDTANVIEYSTISLTADAYWGSGYDPINDRIYFAPNSISDETTWHYIDCTNDSTTTGGFLNSYTVSAITDSAYRGVSYVPELKRLYFAPYNQDTNVTWHYIDCDMTKTLNKIDFSVDETIASDYPLVFPAVQGGSGEVLTNDGSGNLSWSPPLTDITLPDMQQNGYTQVGLTNYINSIKQVNSEGKVVKYSHGIGVIVDSGYFGSVYSPTQNRIYLVPYQISDDATWHYINCLDGSVNAYTHSTGIITDRAYVGGAYSPNQNRIYLVPYGISNVATWHYIDCSDGSVVGYVHGFGTGIVTNAYQGGVYSPLQDRIYLVPRGISDETDWHYIDCSDGSVINYTHATGITVNDAYVGGVYSPSQDRIYLIPFGHSNVANWHYIDCSDGSVNSYVHGFGTGITINGYFGGVYSPTQDRIYLVPFGHANVASWHYIDCSDGSVNSYVHTFGTTLPSAAYTGGVYSPTQDRIYLIPLPIASVASWHYIDCSDGSVNAYVHGFGTSISANAFIGGTYSPTDNRIYLTPNSISDEADWYYIKPLTAANVNISLMSGAMFNKF